MDTVIAVLALLFVLFLALGAYATVKAVGAAKRGVDRTLTQARRTVEDTTLRVRTLALPGPAGELAQLRLRLRTSLRATREALEAGATEDASLKESLGLFERLGAHGRQLDEELRRLEGEPDRSGPPAACPNCVSARSGSPSPPTPCAGRPTSAPAASRRTTCPR